MSDIPPTNSSPIPSYNPSGPVNSLTPEERKMLENFLLQIEVMRQEKTLNRPQLEEMRKALENLKLDLERRSENVSLDLLPHLVANTVTFVKAVIQDAIDNEEPFDRYGRLNILSRLINTVLTYPNIE